MSNCWAAIRILLDPRAGGCDDKVPGFFKEAQEANKRDAARPSTATLVLASMKPLFACTLSATLMRIFNKKVSLL
jgi:hypothetical protein